MSGINSDYSSQRTAAQTDLSNADAASKKAITDFSSGTWTDASGKALSPMPKTAEEWMAALNAGAKSSTGKQDDFKNALQDALNKAFAAGVTLSTLDEISESLKGMKKLIESGDVMGAMMLLQTTRANGLEKQLNTQIGALQMRNARITDLNGQLTIAQKALAGDEKNTTKIEAVGNLKTQIDSLNSTSQLDMVRMQGLVNKRNEAFDLLTNLLSKFQKTIDGIVGNMR